MKPNPVHNGLVSRLILMKSIIKGQGFTSLFKPEIIGAFVPVHSKPDTDKIHLEEAIKWLCRAQDACNGKGVSAAYYFEKGWDVGYPETSGYILSTILKYSKFSGRSDLVERAIKIGDWEIEIQSSDGAIFSSPKILNKRVFNTGQVILGWMHLYETTGIKKYLEAAIKAGNWLISVQEEDGTWRNYTHCGSRTYHSRVDWALLKLEKLTNDERYGEAAIKNLKWVLSQVTDRGWFDLCGFFDYYPVTHVIVYTLRGLLESFLCSDRCSNLGILPVLTLAANELTRIVVNSNIRGIKNLIPSSYDENWKSPDNNSCLTGNAQLAIFLYRFTNISNKKDELIIAADQLCEALKRTQNLNSSNEGVRGAIPGSYPLWEGYAANCYPNWATKFYSDALMMKMSSDKSYFVPA